METLRVRIPAEAAGEFSSPESTSCADSYSLSVPTPVLLQWHVKDPSHSAKSTDGRLHQNMHAPLTQQSQSGLTMPLSRHSVGILSGNELTHNSSGNTWSQSSQLAGPLSNDPGLNNGISVHELISTKKKKKKPRRGMSGRTFSRISRKRGKSHHHHHVFEMVYCPSCACWKPITSFSALETVYSPASMCY